MSLNSFSSDAAAWASAHEAARQADAAWLGVAISLLSAFLTALVAAIAIIGPWAERLAVTLDNEAGRLRLYRAGVRSARRGLVIILQTLKYLRTSPLHDAAMDARIAWGRGELRRRAELIDYFRSRQLDDLQIARLLLEAAHLVREAEAHLSEIKLIDSDDTHGRILGPSIAKFELETLEERRSALREELARVQSRLERRLAANSALTRSPRRVFVAAVRAFGASRRWRRPRIRLRRPPPPSR